MGVGMAASICGLYGALSRGGERWLGLFEQSVGSG